MTNEPVNSDDDIDPDLFEPLIQALTALSSIATLATAWMQLKTESTRRQGEIQKYQYKQFVSEIQRSFSDIFRDVEDIVDIFRGAQLKNNLHLADTKLGFGNAAFKFTLDEFNHFSQLSMKVSQNYLMLKTHCQNLTNTLNHQKAPGENMLQNSLESLNSDLNDILFNSSDFESALRKLKTARKSAEEFIEHLRELGSGSN